MARNNIVVNTAYAGLGTISGKNVRFLNNTLVNVARTHQGGFRAAPNQYGTLPSGVELKNNVVVLDPESVRPLIYLYKFCAITSDYNIWFSVDDKFVLDTTPCGTGGYDVYTGLAAWQATEISPDGSSQATEPMLDAADLYRPFTDSPAIDTGATLAADVPDDYSDVLRPLGAAYDIGAHEGGTKASPPPPPAPPAAPSNLVATAASAIRVDLAWTDNADDEDGFRLERSTDGGKTFALLATVGADVESFADTTVTANKTYYYRVAAYNGAGTSPYSNVAKVRTPRR